MPATAAGATKSAVDPYNPPASNGSGRGPNHTIPVPTKPVLNRCCVGQVSITNQTYLVESFGDDPISKEMQAMVVDSLTNSKVLAVTENKDKADAILKGSTLEKTSQEAHSYSDATSVGVAHGSVHGSSSGNLSGSFVGGTGNINGSSTGSIDGTTNSTTM